MPNAPRPKGKPKKIAYAVVGKPQNMKKENRKQSKVNRRLIFEETFRAR